MVMLVMVQHCMQSLCVKCGTMSRCCCLNVPCDAVTSSMQAAVCALYQAKLGRGSDVLHHSCDVTCNHIYHTLSVRPDFLLIASSQCAHSCYMSTSSMADVCMECVCAENCTLRQGRDEGQDAVAHAIMHAMCTPATNCI